MILRDHRKYHELVHQYTKVPSRLGIETRERLGVGSVKRHSEGIRALGLGEGGVEGGGVVGGGHHLPHLPHPGHRELGVHLADVDLKIVCLSVRLGAVGADKGAHPSVHHEVALKLPCGRKPFATLGTFVIVWLSFV